MSLFHEIIPPVTKTLTALTVWLDVAEEHAKKKSFDPAVLLVARLAPDQYPLRRQIQSTCDQAKFLAARVTGKDAPKHADGDETLAELRARIASVQAFLATFAPADFDGLDDKLMPVPSREPTGKVLLTSDYVRLWGLPNFYFHAVTAYAILRHNGVDLGKRQFIGNVPLRDA